MRISPSLLISLNLALALVPATRAAEQLEDRAGRRAAAFGELHGDEGAGRPAPEPGGRRFDGPVEEGATPMGGGVRFVLRSENATRIELELFGSFDEVQQAELTSALGTPRRVILLEKQDSLWIADVEGVSAGEVYGYRAWGPNWPHDASFRPGTSAGFVADVDAAGNRFNPNKLLHDPWAKVLTRDADWSATSHVSGPKHREKDSAAFQGKSVVVDDGFDWGGSQKPRTPLKDSVVYEVHVRGMTRMFPGLSSGGTYKDLADDRVIAHLKKLGVTAVELLPIHEAANDGNDADPGSTTGKNYWGYMTLAFFAPDRRYSSDTSADGPVREFKEMVKKLHEAGIEVWLDVVYNHTGEGGSWPVGPETSTMLSFRGIDNQMFYELTQDCQNFWDNSGTGSNMRTAHPATGEYIVDSLRYWTEVMQVDGFRFDLASVLGNSISRHGFAFQKTGGLLDRIVKDLGATNDGTGAVKLIAEPWAIGDGTYQVGGFPWGWGEWNGKYRDTLRRFLKGEATAGDVVERMNGSYGLYGDDGRLPLHSVNFLTAHDGLTLFDLVSYNVNSRQERDRLNNQAWPFGPSDGGEEHNNSWNNAVQGASPEATSALRRQQARNAFALLMLSNGTPLILGGDERLRTQHGNNNAYNLDNEANWLDWSASDRVNVLDGIKVTGAQVGGFEKFAQQVVHLRQTFPGLHKPGWWAPDKDQDGDGSPGVRWLAASGAALAASAKSFQGRIDGAQAEVGMIDGDFAAYPLQDHDMLLLVNGDHQDVSFTLAPPPTGKVWRRVIDTASWAEAHGNFWPAKVREAMGGDYGVKARSVAVFLAGD